MSSLETDRRRTITGFSNPTVKFLRSLRDKKHRRIERKFLAEGLRLLTDARASGRLPEMLVMATEREPHRLIEELEKEVLAAGGEVIAMDAAILSKVKARTIRRQSPGSSPSSTPRSRLSIAAPRRSGWWRRRCATPATSARCCARATRLARAG